MRVWIAGAAVACAGMGTVALDVESGATATITRDPVCRITDSRITEASGLVKSPRHDGIWWTTNDSGDRARVFAFDRACRVRAVVTLAASVTDVEALTITPDGDLLLADIGDNLARRRTISVLRFPEPTRLTDRSVDFTRYRFSYPDDATDAETMLVEPRSGRWYVVSKGETATVYAAAERPRPARTNQLARVGSVPGMFTDGMFAADGRTVHLRTYSSIETYTWPGLRTRASVGVPLLDRGAPLQGETLAVGPRPGTFMIGAEGRGSPVFVIEQPGAPAEPSNAAAAVASQTTTAVPSAQAQTPVATSTETDDPFLSGEPAEPTPWYRDAKVQVLGGCLLVSLIAAGAAFFGRSNRG